MCFGEKSKFTTTTKQKIKHKNPCRSRELNTGPLAPKADAVTTARPSELRVLIVVNLFNLNKQSPIGGPHILNKYMFSVIFLHA